MTAETPSKGRRRPVAKPAEVVEEVESTVEEEKGITAAKGRATPGRRQAQPEQEVQRGFFGRIVEYIQGVRSELDKVAWPSREQVIGLFRVVVFVTIVSAAVLGLVAFLFNELFAIGLQNPIVFVVFGLAVAATVFYVMRRNAEVGASR